MGGHERLTVWQRAMQLVAECYRISRQFPRDERYGLAPQLRRAAVSVAANIAEGNGRRHIGDYLRCLSIARGELKELETYLAVSVAVGLSNADDVRVAQGLAEEVSRMLTMLRRRLMRMGNRQPEVG